MGSHLRSSTQATYRSFLKQVSTMIAPDDFIKIPMAYNSSISSPRRTKAS